MSKSKNDSSGDKKDRPMSAGEYIIADILSDGDDVIGIEVDGEQFPFESLCRGDECPYCMQCPMKYAFEIEDSEVLLGSVQLMLKYKEKGCLTARVALDDFLDPQCYCKRELARHEFAYGLVLLGQGSIEGLEWIRSAEHKGNKEAKQFLTNLKLK